MRLDGYRPVCISIVLPLFGEAEVRLFDLGPTIVVIICLVWPYFKLGGIGGGKLIGIGPPVSAEEIAY